MPNTRPSPNPARGRIAYPTAATYVPGNDAEAPDYTPKSPPPQPSALPSSQPSGEVFGIPLAESIKYASVQISTAGADGKLYVWGIIPVVVAKCGLYLKEHATEVEGAFRVSGSAKRMRELQAIFDTGPRFGKNIDWKALDFSPHDVATIFRRFLTLAPESIVPTEFYEDFRAALSDDNVIERYKELVRSIPPINQYLLLYVLDLLSVFARKSDKNLMNASNLALIFQPGVLSHPVHAMRPKEHVLSQQVLEFLIEHQDDFLIGMELAKEPKPKPPPVKADADTMLPSDSDDEAPSGGYYIIEGNPRSPLPGTTKLPLPNLLPPSPVKKSTAPTESISRQVIREDMAASDSDEEAPNGGYEVRVSAIAQDRARRASSSKQEGTKRRGSLSARLLG